MWNPLFKTYARVMILSTALVAYSTSSMAAVDAMHLKAHLQMMDKIAKGTGESRAMGTEGGQITAEYIDDYLADENLTLVGLPFTTQQGQRDESILVTVAGQSSQDVVLIGTHYDSAPKRAGLNDNASGVAVLLELIQYYAKAENKPQYNLSFIFWDGHHADFIGSRALAKELRLEEFGNVHAYIDIDAVASPKPTVNIVTTAANRHAKDAWLAQQWTNFFKAKNIAVQIDTRALAKTDAAAFARKLPVVGLTFTNLDAQKADGCSKAKCDQLSELDINSMQLAAEALQYLIAQLQQAKP